MKLRPRCKQLLARFLASVPGQVPWSSALVKCLTLSCSLLL